MVLLDICIEGGFYASGLSYEEYEDRSSRILKSFCRTLDISAFLNTSHGTLVVKRSRKRKKITITVSSQGLATHGNPITVAYYGDPEKDHVEIDDHGDTKFARSEIVVEVPKHVKKLNIESNMGVILQDDLSADEVFVSTTSDLACYADIGKCTFDEVGNSVLYASRLHRDASLELVYASKSIMVNPKNVRVVDTAALNAVDGQVRDLLKGAMGKYKLDVTGSLRGGRVTIC